MKKSSSVLLTLLISFTVSLSSAQTTQVQDNPNIFVCPEDSLCMGADTLECESPQVTYNYYFRNRFFNNLFRRYFPGRYNTLVYGPNHVSRPPLFYNPAMPHHRTTSHMPMSSARRGGFGSTGSGHSQSN